MTAAGSPASGQMCTRGADLLPPAREFVASELRGAGGERRVALRVSARGLRVRSDDGASRELLSAAPRDIFTVRRRGERLSVQALRAYHFVAEDAAAVADHARACGLGRAEALEAQKQGCRSRVEALGEEEVQLTHECIAFEAHLERLREQVRARREAATVHAPDVLAPAAGHAQDIQSEAALEVWPAPGTIAASSPVRQAPASPQALQRVPAPQALSPQVEQAAPVPTVAPRTAAAQQWAASTPYMQAQARADVAAAPLSVSAAYDSAYAHSTQAAASAAAANAAVATARAPQPVPYPAYTPATALQAQARAPTTAMRRPASRPVWRANLPAPTPAPSLHGPGHYGGTPAPAPAPSVASAPPPAAEASAAQAEASRPAPQQPLPVFYPAQPVAELATQPAPGRGWHYDAYGRLVWLG